MQLPHVTMVLKASASQQAALDQLLAQQQDPSSPNYHQWLTPEQYADQFGVSQADIDKIVAWLGRHGLAVKSVSRGRTAIVMGGAASQIESAFGVQIHRYQFGGESHFANATDPVIPAALQGLVLAVRGLHDFRLKPRVQHSAQPRYNVDGSHSLGPGDIATIYNIAPLHDAGITGSGQKIAVAGQTDIYMSDIEQFRSLFGLPSNDPAVILVPGSPDPGIQDSSTENDLQEADLDLELSGGIAWNASILFVTSSANFGYGGAFESLYYAIDQNLAPVVSISYGDCELDMGSAEALTLQSWAMQGNAQGQTIFAASGDDGAADCYGLGDPLAINNALSVDAPGSVPQVTSVGGTKFNEGGGSYWSSSNGSNQASALSYIPETAWNDSTEDGMPTASGGGASALFPKPSWQTGAGVPNDGARDVPDVSIAASAYHDGYYIINDGSFVPIGGTSVGGPQFAGIAALLSQYLVDNGLQSSPNLGNVNPTLYPLAPVTGVFHDITTGNNIVNPCEGLRDCTSPSIGYEAGPGYDQVTGLGTPNVYNLVTAWRGHTVTGKASVAMTLTASATSVTFSGAALLTATVKGANGAAPTGTVTFSTATNTLGTATVNASGVATLTLSGIQLAAGVNSLTASYSGNSSYYGETATASVTVTSPTNGTPTIGGVANAASYSQSFAAGGILSVFGTQLAPASGSAPSLPLPIMLAGTTVTINGYNAPLYYVSPKQLNIQIPYEVVNGSTEALSSLTVDNNGASSTYSFYVAAAAPGIFTTNSQGTGPGAILNTSYQLVDASYPATPGSTYIQIYCAGLGPVTNQPADGAVALSVPLSKTTTTPQVTIGGVPATDVTFSGLAPSFVGEYQVNVLVPAGVAAGSAVPVTVSIGGATSNTVTIAVD